MNIGQNVKTQHKAKLGQNFKYMLCTDSKY